MKGYNVKIKYKKEGLYHCFKLQLGDAWKDEEIITRIQLKGLKERKVSDIEIKDLDFGNAYLGMRVVFDRSVWIQQYLDVMEKIYGGKVEPQDYKDVPQDYVGYENYVNQSVNWLANDLDVKIHESDFLLKKPEKLYNMKYYFTDKYEGWRRMMAAGLRQVGMLDNDVASKKASVFKVIKTANNHLVALDSQNNPLPYFTEKKLKNKTDMITAEWDLYEALSQINGIDTAQMLLFIGYRPSRSITDALKSLTHNKNIITYVSDAEVTINKENYEILSEYINSDESIETKQPLLS